MCKHGHDLDTHAQLRTLSTGRVKRESRLCEAARHAKGTHYYAAHPRALRGDRVYTSSYAKGFIAAFPAYGQMVYGRGDCA